MNSEIKAQWHKSIQEITKQNWQSILGNETIPFFHWDWLNTLETSESISSKYGWQPIHLTLWDKKKIIAFAPLYLKNHSFGEFIFDHPFVELANHLGLNYYPKLIGMTPLSPVEGYQFFISQEYCKRQITKIMMNYIDEFALKNGILSCNFLYVDEQWKQYGESANCLCWINKQSLWSSKGEENFDDYLQRFNANQRRNIKRERQSIQKAGLNISILNFDQIDLEILEMMYYLYSSHCKKWGYWGSKYLTKDFFINLFNCEIKDQIVLFNANRGNIKEPIAMSICLANNNMLWGRYWGSNEDIKNLHFNLCYYSPISWSIKNGINQFDPGAGGQHKARRGFEAKPCFSLHRWYEKRMESYIKEWLKKVNDLTIQQINASNNEVPFKKKQIDLL